MKPENGQGIMLTGGLGVIINLHSSNRDDGGLYEFEIFQPNGKVLHRYVAYEFGIPGWSWNRERGYWE